MITLIIISIFLIQSCYCGSSGSPKQECKKEKGFFGKLWSAIETIISFICFLNGIWNTVMEWRNFFNNTTLAANASK
ncbi:unnamed protein product [Schistosoma spindalis]|nr:unnamed protein product [Schistosoma spindale]